jgi:hypothetical protein
MPLRPNASAPYGPPAGVLAVIHGYRDRGLATPFTAEVLLRLGISDSLVPRVLKSLEGLDLVDKDGNPTPQLDGLRRATSGEFPARLEEVVRAVYADVFNFVDPVKDTVERVADAFRAYEPVGQRGRMVTLFLGLCEAAGIIQPTAKKSAPSTAPRPAATPKNNRPAAAPRTRAPQHPPPPAAHAGNGSFPPAVAGVLASLPQNGQGWTPEERDRFIEVFEAVIKFSYPVGQPSAATSSDENAEDE